MGLKYCPICGSDVSATPMLCPECGCSVSMFDGPLLKNTEDYSWDELSQISAEISDAGNEMRGIEVAKRYGLCNSDGTLDGTQSKHVLLENGIPTRVHIIGFNHDDKVDGSGKAGISFLFVNCIAEHVMNSTWTNEGGWEACEMRRFLNESLINDLPYEIRSQIVPVKKLTNNEGVTENADSVSSTSDCLWLLSSKELHGKLIEEDRFSISAHNDIQDAEGSQYKLFKDMNVKSDYRAFFDNDFFLRKYYLPSSHVHNNYRQGSSCAWWLRSPLPYGSGPWQFVSEGSRRLLGAASASEGVCPGFCI